MVRVADGVEEAREADMVAEVTKEVVMVVVAQEGKRAAAG